MGIINILPGEISNKIAAGEVVERPASVVKELVENSIDAGSTAVSVEIKKGGITYIRVSDNGKGMSREDAEIAFLRHATSKIHSADDLDAIYTLGFRGEALSSIGAVSKTNLYTKRRSDEVGTHVMCCGGEIESSAEEGMPDGTVFEVCSLFYNTPARMNFLKRDATEAAAITDIMERFILSHPEISFRYTIDGKEKYFTSGDGNPKSSFYAVYGRSYINSVIPVDYQTELLRITGLVGKGDAVRPNRSYQSFFVNGRYVKSIRLSNTAEAAYKNQIMVNKHPMLVLNIEIDPRLTNVNVHPTKLEVKFSRDDEVFRAVFHAVENALYTIVNVPKIERSEPRYEFERDKASTAAQETIAGDTSAYPQNQPVARTNVKMNGNEPVRENAERGAENARRAEQPPESAAEVFGECAAYPQDENNAQSGAHTAQSAVPGQTSQFASVEQATKFAMSEQTSQSAAPGQPAEIPHAEGVQKGDIPDWEKAYAAAYPQDKDNRITTYALNNDEDYFRRKRAELVGDKAEAPEADNDSLAEISESIKVEILTSNLPADFERGEENGHGGWNFDRSELRVIGQLFNTYIIAQSGDTMIIADQHAAHERLKYEELKKSLAEHRVHSQMLLAPVAVNVTAGEHAVFMENTEKFAELGFEIEDFGEDALIIRATPEPLDSEELKQLVLEIIGNLSDGSRGAVSEKTEHALYTIACKAAVKANHKYDNKQLEALLNAVLDMGNINTCPHGRPIIITMTKKELEREFKRIV